MDIMSKKERSKRMSLIRSKWTKQEKKLHNFLKGNKVKHQMHPRLPGSPDVQIGKTLVFLHGCFWHRCPACYKEPSVRKDFWIAKVQNNATRHKRNVKILKKEGYKILVFWEHDLQKNFEKVMKKLSFINGKN